MSTLQAAFPGTMWNETARRVVMEFGTHRWLLAPGQPDADFVDIPGDAGGPTKWGVSQAATLLNTGRLWTPDEIRALVPDRVFAYAVLYYWRDIYGLIRVQDVASKLFDVGWIDGPGSAVRLLQKALVILGNSLDVDGMFGNQTLAKVNACDPDALLSEFCDVQLDGYEAEVQRDPTQQKFLHDWEVRAHYLDPRKAV